jgi:hypothetical protein
VAESTPAPAEPPAEPAPAVEPEPVITPEPVAETTDTPAPAADPEGTPVSTSSTTTAPRDREPILASSSGSRVYAGADLPGFSAGIEFPDRQTYAKAYAGRVNSLTRLSGGDGERVVIASIRNDVDESRTLSFNDPEGNTDKIQAITDIDSLVSVEDTPYTITAAGGCCAPLVTRYDLFDCGGDTSRPVRDSLAGFRADRGGIRFWRGPNLGDLTGAVGFWTCADDEAADPEDPQTWKVCARIDCPPEETAELQAVTLCLTFGVIQSRVFPELTTANNKLSLVAQSRIADSALLAQIKAGSTAVTDGGTALSAVRDLLTAIGRAAYYYRDRYRIKNAPLRAIFPAWVIEVLRGDMILGQDFGTSPADFFGISEDEIRSFFTRRNINVTWALDSSAPATNGGGFLPAISGAALPAWPTSVEWALYPEGTWLYLDGGELNLGVVRDSTLVRTNDYMEFSENFEAAANIGCESLWITSTISVSGKAQGPVAG